LAGSFIFRSVSVLDTTWLEVVLCGWRFCVDPIGYRFCAKLNQLVLPKLVRWSAIFLLI